MSEFETESSAKQFFSDAALSIIEEKNAMRGQINQLTPFLYSILRENAKYKKPNSASIAVQQWLDNFQKENLKTATSSSSMSGWLRKQSGSGITKKMRWVVLDGTSLSYFKDRSENELLGVLQLRGAQITVPSDGYFGSLVGSSSYYFEISGSKRKDEGQRNLSRINVTPNSTMASSLLSANTTFAFGNSNQGASAVPVSDIGGDESSTSAKPSSEHPAVGNDEPTTDTKHNHPDRRSFQFSRLGSFFGKGRRLSPENPQYTGESGSHDNRRLTPTNSRPFSMKSDGIPATELSNADETDEGSDDDDDTCVEDASRSHKYMNAKSGELSLSPESVPQPLNPFHKSKKVYTWIAESREERDRWVKALQKASELGTGSESAIRWSRQLSSASSLESYCSQLQSFHQQRSVVRVSADWVRLQMVSSNRGAGNIQFDADADVEYPSPQVFAPGASAAQAAAALNGALSGLLGGGSVLNAITGSYEPAVLSAAQIEETEILQRELGLQGLFSGSSGELDAQYRHLLTALVTELESGSRGDTAASLNPTLSSPAVVSAPTTATATDFVGITDGDTGPSGAGGAQGLSPAASLGNLGVSPRLHKGSRLLLMSRQEALAAIDYVRQQRRRDPTMASARLQAALQTARTKLANFESLKCSLANAEAGVFLRRGRSLGDAVGLAQVRRDYERDSVRLNGRLLRFTDVRGGAEGAVLSALIQELAMSVSLWLMESLVRRFFNELRSVPEVRADVLNSLVSDANPAFCEYLKRLHQGIVPPTNMNDKPLSVEELDRLEKAAIRNISSTGILTLLLNTHIPHISSRLIGFCRDVLAGSSRTVTGGDSFDALEYVFRNPDLVFLSSDSGAGASPIEFTVYGKQQAEGGPHHPLPLETTLTSGSSNSTHSSSNGNSNSNASTSSRAVSGGESVFGRRYSVPNIHFQKSPTALQAPPLPRHQQSTLAAPIIDVDDPQLFPAIPAVGGVTPQELQLSENIAAYHLLHNQVGGTDWALAHSRKPSQSSSNSGSASHSPERKSQGTEKKFNFFKSSTSTAAQATGSATKPSLEPGHQPQGRDTGPSVSAKSRPPSVTSSSLPNHHSHSSVGSFLASHSIAPTPAALGRSPTSSSPVGSISPSNSLANSPSRSRSPISGGAVRKVIGRGRRASDGAVLPPQLVNLTDKYEYPSLQGSSLSESPLNSSSSSNTGSPESNHSGGRNQDIYPRRRRSSQLLPHPWPEPKGVPRVVPPTTQICIANIEACVAQSGEIQGLKSQDVGEATSKVGDGAFTSALASLPPPPMASLSSSSSSFASGIVRGQSSSSVGSVTSEGEVERAREFLDISSAGHAAAQPPPVAATINAGSKEPLLLLPFLGKALLKHCSELLPQLRVRTFARQRYRIIGLDELVPEVVPIEANSMVIAPPNDGISDYNSPTPLSIVSVPNNPSEVTVSATRSHPYELGVAFIDFQKDFQLSITSFERFLSSRNNSNSKQQFDLESALGGFSDSFVGGYSLSAAPASLSVRFLPLFKSHKVSSSRRTD